LRGTDTLSTEVLFISEKIKKQKLVGIPFQVEMDFNRKKNRYFSVDGKDYFNGSIERDKPIINDGLALPF
jgi:hypothetical protein